MANYLDQTISDFCVKLLRYDILKPLCFIFNLSLSSGIFPDILKTSKVFPLYKSGSRCDIKNYRPISLTSVFSKIFEKIIHKRMVSFLTKFNLLYPYQFGF